MAKLEIVLPQMGEGVIEATLTKWLKKTGDLVEEEEPIAEVATDKVDTEITAPSDGVITETFFKEGDVVPVGTVIAMMEIKQENNQTDSSEDQKKTDFPHQEIPFLPKEDDRSFPTDSTAVITSVDRFYSPLVKSIIQKENLSQDDLKKIRGTGINGRLTKNDLLSYLEKRLEKKTVNTTVQKEEMFTTKKTEINSSDEIIEMDRMRKLIADNMLMSVKTSPHVTSFIDVDLTKVVEWRKKVKEDFFQREGVKLTFTPIFFEAAALALKDFPRINASVDGYNMVLHKKINIGMATALPNGNLIVPVIKDADKKSLLGLTQEVNDLAKRARNNRLRPDEITGGTFTITNFGSFDSLTGTPIINQPQVAILAVGAIRKKPVVLETESGDVIAIRHIVILSMAYDHRIVDGAMGGLFLKKVKEILENWDMNRKI
jgi:2-oxoglutarate dehydrogenase E2 component (dihydrolipoamide succinyltransferase)